MKITIRFSMNSIATLRKNYSNLLLLMNSTTMISINSKTFKKQRNGSRLMILTTTPSIFVPSANATSTKLKIPRFAVKELAALTSISMYFPILILIREETLNSSRL